MCVCVCVIMVKCASGDTLVKILSHPGSGLSKCSTEATGLA